MTLPLSPRSATSIGPNDPDALSKILGSSPAMAKIRRLISQAGPTHLSVLIVGESGTGKELVAAALSSLSARRHAAYVSVNCATISPEVAESELFGHERGAFTGAHGNRQGLFEEASGGTLFLDEVGDLPLALQPKLLRVLETGRLRRVGGRGECEVDVRVLAATHRFDERHLRIDLYHRLAQVVIALPPLRERMEDLSTLAAHMAGLPLSQAVLAKLSSHDWPGNVRELRNVLLRARLLGQGDEKGIIRPEHIWFDTGRYRDRQGRLVAARLSGAEAIADHSPSRLAQHGARDELGSGQLHLEALVGKMTLDRMADEAMSIALRRSRGNRRQAARILGIPRTTLGERVRRLRSRRPAEADGEACTIVETSASDEEA